jgi:TRAP-type mannitol/chloroaromatic compound transport system permease small subunit
LLLIQGIAQVFRCVLCIREGQWPPIASDVEETETMLMKQAAAGQTNTPA